MKIFLIIITLINYLNAIGFSDEKFVGKNKVVTKTTVETYTMKNLEVEKEVKTYGNFYHYGKSVIQHQLSGDAYKVNVIYQYEGNTLDNNNINDIRTFKKTNINDFIKSNGSNDLNNQLSVSYTYQNSGTGQTIGALSNTQGVSEVMSVSTYEDTKAMTLTLTAQRLNGMAFYGDKIIKSCKDNKPIPKYLITDTKLFKNFLIELMGDTGNFKEVIDMDKLKTYKNKGLGVSLDSLGINSDSCSSIIKNPKIVYQAILDTKLFNEDGTINSDSKNIYVNKSRTSKIMADVMYDTHTDSSYLRYDDKWKTKSGKRCIKSVKFLGCIKHRMWQAFSLSNNIDKITTKKYTSDNTVFNNDPSKIDELTNISGLYPQNAFQDKDKVFHEGNSFNFLIVNKNIDEEDNYPLRSYTVPNERKSGTYDLEEHEDKGWGIIQWITFVVVAIAVVVVVMLSMGSATPLLGLLTAYGGSSLVTTVALQSIVTAMLLIPKLEIETSNGINNASVINNTDILSDSLKSEFSEIKSLEQSSKIMNFLNSNNIRNNLADKVTSESTKSTVNNSNSKYLSNIFTDISSRSEYSFFNSLFMKEFNDSFLNILKNTDSHGTQIEGKDYFKKVNGKIEVKNSIIQPYLIFKDTKFNQSHVDLLYKLGNSIRYGVTAVSGGKRNTVLFDMTGDFNKLLDIEYGNIQKNFFTEGVLNNNF